MMFILFYLELLDTYLTLISKLHILVGGTTRYSSFNIISVASTFPVLRTFLLNKHINIYILKVTINAFTH